jgi:4-amino-4-deoxy-L-arabinose transferase-like glycosyltransferase
MMARATMLRSILEAPARALARVPPALQLAAVLALGAGLWLDGHRRFAWEIEVPDAMEYAEIARHLADGQGFTTSLIYPAELEYGVRHDHPSLVRPPVWPLLLAAGFALFGPQGAVAHALLGVVHLATLAAAMALAGTLAGRGAALAAGLAVASSPQIVSVSMLAGADPALGLWFTLVWLGVARRVSPLWVGACCALAFLTRYNGVAVLGAVLCVLLVRGGREARRDVALCLLGFVAVSLPWWLRNAQVTGNPFFSLYRWGVYFSPIGVRDDTRTLLNMLEPDVHSEMAMHPLEKLRLLLPMLLLLWPPAAANLSACAGLALACWRRERVAWGHLLLAGATTLIVAIALPRGRYFVPLLPALLAIGSASWLRYGGRLRLPGLALLLLAPLLPSVPIEAQDMALYRLMLRAPPRTAQAPRSPEPWQACLGPGDVVFAEEASALAWKTDALTIWLSASAADFWTIVEREPVSHVYLRRRTDLRTPRFERSFEPLPGCGPFLYRRIPPGAGRIERGRPGVR